MARRRARHALPPSKRIMIGLLLGGLMFFALGACGLVVAARKPGRPATPVGTPQALLPVPKGKRAAVPVPAADDRAAVPVSITIPVIDVRSRLLRLGQTRSGALQVPPVTTVAGWFKGSPRPGDIGSSIIIGHVDSVQGPGIFYRLRLMRPGERVYVRQASGKVAVFRVTGVRQYLKAAFPASAVYGGTPTAQLRLITCGGHFDQATGHYLSNVVVYATLVS